MTMDTVKDLESLCAGYADKLSNVTHPEPLTGTSGWVIL